VAQSRVTVKDLRRSNRASLLRSLFFGGPTSRPELGRITGLSSASVTNVVSDLLAEGLVVEAGAELPDGGRPPMLLRVNPNFATFVGVDVGETAITVELFDLGMNKIAETAASLRPHHHEPGVVARYVLQGLEAVLAQAGVEESGVLGMGISVPGVVEASGAAVVHASAFGWDGVPFGAMLSSGTTLPILMDNGAKNLGRAEMWFGAGRGARDAVVLLLGTGVGAAIFTDGALYRGAASSAGEWGHTNVVVDGRPCRCGAYGCLEAYVGAGAIGRRWLSLSRSPRTDIDDEPAILASLLDAVPRSKTASKVVDEVGTYMATGVANLVNLFNPERIVIGGWAGLLLGPHVLSQVRDVVGRQALTYSASRVSIELGELPADAVALGAATLVADQLLSNGGIVQPRKRNARSASGLRSISF
jgi:predicted NBD/HSP70 family sugar kinase